tara:strand:- start:1605 stop:2429 length:825 start_codon:yes stop_codon:yes gene_type:complete
MAESKHKSKWKAPKDDKKSQKPDARKDIKDYVGKDDVHGMVPDLVKGVQPLVARNINGEVIDDVENMVPKIKDRIYKDVEEGKYSPADALKLFKKLQIEDSEGYLKAMEDGVYEISESISKLSESQKEKLVRKYIRNKIVKVLQEQETPPAEEPLPATELPTEAPPAEPAAEPAAEPVAPTPESDVDIDSDDVKTEKLKNIQKSPELFRDYLEIHKDKMNITKLVKVGLDPLLDSLQSLDTKQQTLAMRMMIQSIQHSKKDYAKADLADDKQTT